MVFRVLVVSDKALGKRLAIQIRAAHFDGLFAESLSRAERVLAKPGPWLVFASAEMNPLELLRYGRPVVVVGPSAGLAPAMTGGATDYLRTLAISRIALDNFANIQSSWVTQGKAVGQMTLTYGANDLGSLMMEESVVSKAGVSHPLTRTDLDEMIVGAGFTPTLRDNGYNFID